MACSGSSVDTGSHLVSARVKDKELYLFNFSSNCKTNPRLEKSQAKSKLQIWHCVLHSVGHLWFKMQGNKRVAVT